MSRGNATQGPARSSTYVPNWMTEYICPVLRVRLIPSRTVKVPDAKTRYFLEGILFGQIFGKCVI